MGVVIRFYLSLPYSKIFFDLLMTRTLDLCMVDVLVPINWAGGPVEGG